MQDSFQWVAVCWPAWCGSCWTMLPVSIRSDKCGKPKYYVVKRFCLSHCTPQPPLCVKHAHTHRMMFHQLKVSPVRTRTQTTFSCCSRFITAEFWNHSRPPHCSAPGHLDRRLQNDLELNFSKLKSSQMTHNDAVGPCDTERTFSCIVFLLFYFASFVFSQTNNSYI